MRVLVTGGAGFIGVALCRRLLREPGIASVTVLDDASTGRLDALSDLPARVVAGSVLDRDLLDRSIEDADTVIHLAARWGDGVAFADPLDVHDVNATGTVRVLEAACRSGRPHVVLCHHLAGSGGVNDAVTASFVAAAAAAAAYRMSFGVRLTEFRIAEVHGPGRPAGHPKGRWLDEMVSSALAGEPVAIDADGATPRETIDVASVCDLITTVTLEAITTPGPVDVSGHAPVTQIQAISHLSTLLDREIEVRRVDQAAPAPLLKVDRDLLAATVPSFRARRFADTISLMIAERRLRRPHNVG